MSFMQTAARKVAGPGSAIGKVLEMTMTPHAIDRYLELVDPMITWDEARARVERVERRTDRSVTLTLRTTRQFDGFRAGQFVQLGVVIDGVRQVRCFSPANSDAERGIIELTIGRRPGGLVSNHLYEHAQVGDVYTLTSAAGSFQLPEPRPAQTLLIAGGSGITPVLSMARSLVGNGYPGSIALLYYVPSEADNPYRDELAALADIPSVSVHCIYPESKSVDGPIQLRPGFFGADHLDTVAPWADHGQTFMCGPQPLMDSVTALFTERGLTDRLHSEEFVIAMPSVAEGDAEGTVTFSGSNKNAENDGRSILDQAESAGLTPEFGCRMGICFSCTAVKKSGCTRNILTGDLNDDPDQHIQLCVSAPVGDVDIEI